MTNLMAEAETKEAHTPDWQTAVAPLCDAAQQAMARRVKAAMDEAYEDFMNGVQDWLKENVEFNLASLISMHERERRGLRETVDGLAVRVDRLAADRRALLAALKSLQDGGFLTKLESDASGNPEWDRTNAAITAARAAISRAEA